MAAAATVAISLTANPTQAAPSTTVFESGQVRPLALSPDGKHLFAVNTPDNRLEIFQVTLSGLSHVSSVTTGLEPVAIAARSNGEVWVVNHLSDSISIVDVTNPKKAHVARTLFVGDEPRDIVFGGPGRDRAFITAAHRGQHLPFDPEFTTQGVPGPRGDVHLRAARLGPAHRHRSRRRWPPRRRRGGCRHRSRRPDQPLTATTIAQASLVLTPVVRA